MTKKKEMPKVIYVFADDEDSCYLKFNDDYTVKDLVMDDPDVEGTVLYEYKLVGKKRISQEVMLVDEK